MNPSNPMLCVFIQPNIPCISSSPQKCIISLSSTQSSLLSHLPVII